MLKIIVTILIILTICLESFAQSKLNDTIGGVILVSHRYHRQHLPFIRFKTVMYFINIEDEFVLRFDGFQATMDGKLLSINMVDSLINLSYAGYNRITRKAFTETISYDMRKNKYLLKEENKRTMYTKARFEFTEGQAWYMIPE